MNDRCVRVFLFTREVVKQKGDFMNDPSGWKFLHSRIQDPCAME